jgi:hypothetical protein
MLAESAKAQFKIDPLVSLHSSPFLDFVDEDI